MSEHTALFTEMYWFQKLLEMKFKKKKMFWMMLQKWLTLSNKDHLTPEYLKKKLCENLDKQHLNLLLHTEIRWLSGGTVLNIAFVLKAE
jgi:hypothetical protein